MSHRILRMAALLLLTSAAISCAGPAPTEPARPAPSPSPTDAVDLEATVGEPATPTPAGPQEVEAILVYSQPPDPDGGLIPSSRRVPEGGGTIRWAWENFSFETIQTITEVRWRGAYDPTKGGSGGPVRNFTVDFYPSIPEGSEPDVAKGPLIRYEVGGNANETEAETVGDVRMYDYSFVLPVPFEAAAYTPYWVQIEAEQEGDPDWALSKGTRGDSQHFRRILGGTSNIYQYAPGDAAVDLLAPGLAGATDGQGVPLLPPRVASQGPLPPAEVVPVNADGVQEVVLVISRSGYTPTHFAVKAGIPVRVVFRQLGYVPGGNILLLRWGQQQEQYLVLSSVTDTQVIEFTPQEPGDYVFRCPHDWYDGVMTVQD